MDASSKLPAAKVPTTLSIPKVEKQMTAHDKGDNSSDYRCDMCGKTYSQLSHLENHRTITHSLTLRIKNNSYHQNTNHHYRGQQVGLDGTIKSHKCEECGKFFTRGYHLDRHKLIHTGIRPYKCTVCQKEFTRNYHLDRHMYTHTGEKPYSCEICAKAFSRTDKLKKHTLTHLAPLIKRSDEFQ
ncbi:KRAB [Acanthosepion pharaonis]|uniref:KRAB n=1 Tax=Acanthosepion pharaonis TaxID=158019 RepID=A0A812DJP4_ACAPH|nr:KRAB [Sepia pharaonis]